MTKDSEEKLVIAGIVLVGGFILWKMGKNKGESDTDDKPGGIISDCNSALSNSDCKAIAQKLRSLLDEYYVDGDAEQQIVLMFKKIPDECSYQKVYQAFGTLTHYFPPTFFNADLETAMSARCSQETLNKCRIPGTSF